MAIRTISAAGGNWNSTATWVGGVIPTTSDSVLGDATSGPLTMNVGATVQFVDFTNYTQTLTFNNFLQVNLTSATNTFGAGMSFAGTSAFNFFNSPGTLIQNTTNEIPNLTCANGVKTISTDIYCAVFNINNTQTFNGNTIYSSSQVNTSFAAFNGTTNLHLIGSGSLTILNFNGGELVINTTGSYTILNRLGIGANSLNKSVVFKHLQGTIVNPNINGNANYGASSNITLNLISGTTWDFIYVGSQNNLYTFTFSGDCYFNNFILHADGEVATAGTNKFILNGSSLNINNFSTLMDLRTPTAIFTPSSYEILFDSNATYTFNNSFQVNANLEFGYVANNPNIQLKSNIPSTSTNFVFNTYNQYVSSCSFTDIDCSGGNTLYGQNLTLSNTTNITQYTLPPSGGGGGQTAYTFFS